MNISRIHSQLLGVKTRRLPINHFSHPPDKKITPFLWTTVIQKNMKPLNMRMGGFERLPLKFLQEARIRGQTECCGKSPCLTKVTFLWQTTSCRNAKKFSPYEKKNCVWTISPPLCKYHCPHHSSLTMTNAEI